MDFWNVASSESSDVTVSNSFLETTLLFVGNCNSGKTSLILKFLERDEVPKPTIGLDYTFGRRSKASNVVTHIVHVVIVSQIYTVCALLPFVY
jgi:dynein light intermediate chain 2